MCAAQLDDPARSDFGYRPAINAIIDRLGAVVDIMCSTLSGLGPGFIALVPGFHFLAYRIDAFIEREGMLN